MGASIIKWFDEAVQRFTYPLRATVFDKALVIIQLGAYITLMSMMIAALIQWLCV